MWSSSPQLPPPKFDLKGTGNTPTPTTGSNVDRSYSVVVAPPSIHPSGRPYAWEVSHHPDETPLALLPLWLRGPGVDGAERVGHPLVHWRHLVRDGVPEGERNNTIASLTGHLLWHGVDPEVVLELLVCWNRMRCRPPLPDEEVARTVESIRRTHQRHQGEQT